MKKCLITGSEGFLGNYLSNFLINKKFKVFCLYKKNKFINKHKNISYLRCNVKNKKKMSNLIKKIRPDFIFHLAAKSHPNYSFKLPIQTIETNILGTMNILEAVKKFSNSSKVIIACSSAQYGQNLINRHKKVIENLNYDPDHFYGLSKYFQNRIGDQYHKMYGLNVVNAIIFNTSGPGKVGDVFFDFVTRFLKKYKKNNKSISFSVGNLENQRDFLHFSDTINALYCLAIKGKSGHSYNICTSKLNKIGTILSYLSKKFSTKITINKKKELLREFDEKIIIGNNNKLKNLGWRPKKDIYNIIDDMCDYYQND